MRNNLTLILIAFIISSLGLNAQKIDSQDSRVLFEVGNLKINTVEGSFKGMRGNVKFNPSEIAKAEFDVCVDAATVDTDNSKRDEHLRSEEFFNPGKFPKICIEVVRIQKDGDKYMANSRLTMLGVTRDVLIPFTFSDQTLKGTFSIQRLNYGLGADTSTFMISNEVEITIICKLQI